MAYSLAILANSRMGKYVHKKKPEFIWKDLEASVFAITFKIGNLITYCIHFYTSFRMPLLPPIIP